MIRQDGSIHFAEEIIALIDRFLDEYQDAQGELGSDLERGLIIAYALRAVRCDLELLGECLESDGVFGSLSPHRVLDECSDANTQGRSRRRAELLAELHERGWLPLAPADE
jgi:hypothetical protein